MLVGQSSGWTAGQVFATNVMGAGRCTRHFYNNSDYWWAVGLWDSGFCHIDGEPANENANICMIPPHKVGVLDYINTGGNAGAFPRILVAGVWRGGNFRNSFTLRTPGCYINHSGNTGNIVVNDPADGDVVTCGPYKKGQKAGGYDCR